MKWNMPPPERLPQTLGEYWRAVAACKDADVKVFYPPISRAGASQQAVDEALSYCAACPVRLSCLRHAMEHEPDVWPLSGVMGGMTPPERRRYRLRLQEAGEKVARTTKPRTRGASNYVAVPAEFG